MPLHLIKLAVGIDSVDHLRERQHERRAARAAAGGPDRLQFLTRHMPRRAAEILDGGGSLYWVIRGRVQARQRLLAIEPATNAAGEPRCALVYDPEIVPTRPRRHRPFQGWRYLRGEDAPPDRPGGIGAGDEPPAEMAAELRELGLI